MWEMPRTDEAGRYKGVDRYDWFIHSSGQTYNGEYEYDVGYGEAGGYGQASG